MRMSRRMGLYARMQSGQPLSNLAIGSKLAITENSILVPFLVLKHGYPSAGNGLTLLLRESCYTTAAFGSNNRGTNEIPDWMGKLANGYFPRIDASVSALIPEVSIHYCVPREYERAYSYKYKLLRVFFLSLNELGITIDSDMPTEGNPIAYFDSDMKRVATYNGSANRWWTRSPHAGSSSSNRFSKAYRIETNGTVSYSVTTGNLGSRPAFTLPASLMVSLEPDASGVYSIV